jgi:glycogen phosphorylase
VKAIRRFTVRTVLPQSLSALDELAANLRWSWHEPTRRLFEEIDPEIWRSVASDPVALLGAVSPARIGALAADPEFVGRANALRDGLATYCSEPRW